MGWIGNGVAPSWFHDENSGTKTIGRKRDQMNWDTGPTVRWDMLPPIRWDQPLLPISLEDKKMIFKLIVAFAKLNLEAFLGKVQQIKVALTSEPALTLLPDPYFFNLSRNCFRNFATFGAITTRQ